MRTESVHSSWRLLAGVLLVGLILWGAYSARGARAGENALDSGADVGDGIDSPLVLDLVDVGGREDSGEADQSATVRRAPTAESVTLVTLPPGFGASVLAATVYSGVGRAVGKMVEPVAALVKDGDRKNTVEIGMPESGGVLLVGPGIAPLAVPAGDPVTREFEASPLTPTRIEVFRGADQFVGNGQLLIHGIHTESGGERREIQWSWETFTNLSETFIPTVFGPCVVEVRVGEDVAVWTGELPVTEGSILLLLRKPIRVHGRVIDMPTDISGARVQARQKGGTPWLPSSTVPVLNGGRFTFLRMPGNEFKEIVLRLDHPQAIPDETLIIVAKGVSAVETTLRWRSGNTLQVLARTEKGDSVPGIRIQLQWQRAETWNRQESLTGSDGIANFTAVDDGEVWVRAFGPGFAKEALGPFDLPRPTSAPLPITLWAAGSILGLAGPPELVEDGFSITYWPKGGPTQKVDFGPESQGRFEIEPVKVGDITLIAVGKNHETSEEVGCEVRSGQGSEVELRLDSPVAVSGRVIDFVTGIGIPGAVVVAWVLGREVAYPAELERKVTCDRDGYFNDLLVPASGTAITPVAEGYATGILQIAGPIHSGFEGDPIRMQKHQGLTISLVGRSLAGERFRFESGGLRGMESTYFPESGTLHFPSCDPAEFARLGVFTPSNSVYDLETTLIQGRLWEYEILIDTGRTVIADLRPAMQDLGLGAYQVRTQYVLGNGDILFHTRVVPSGDREIALVDIPATVCLVELIFNRKRTGATTVDLTEMIDHRVLLEVAEYPVQFKLVADGDWKWNQFFMWVVPGPSSVLGVKCSISSDGIADAPGVIGTEGGVFVWMSSPALMFHSYEQFSDDGEAPVLLELETPAKVELTVVPLLGAAQALQCSIEFENWSKGVMQQSTTPDGRMNAIRFSPGRYLLRVIQPGFWQDELVFEALAGTSSFELKARRIGGLRVRVMSGGAASVGTEVVVWSTRDSLRATAWSGLVASTSHVKTDEDGWLYLPALPEGEYEVWVAGNRSVHSEHLNVLSAGVVDVTLNH